MEPVSSFFKEENDILYIVGQRQAREEEKTNFVKKLLLSERFTISEIANFADVTEAFVKKVKEGK